jgi:tagatose-1,6-bisphosphate aldolase non-catalytic subunit AgaZ/GatZ
MLQEELLQARALQQARDQGKEQAARLPLALQVKVPGVQGRALVCLPSRIKESARQKIIGQKRILYKTEGLKIQYIRISVVIVQDGLAMKCYLFFKLINYTIL